MQLSLAYRADVLIAAPKVVQAVFAACGDYYTWKLAKRVYGHGSNEAWAAVRSFLDRSRIDVIFVNLLRLIHHNGNIYSLR